jgi:hypothetical protein
MELSLTWDVVEGIYEGTRTAIVEGMSILQYGREKYRKRQVLA